jgi:hypothetical protein
VGLTNQIGGGVLPPYPIGTNQIMTKQEAKDKLSRAQELIFEVEKEFIEGELPRRHGYRATFENNIDYSFWNKDGDLTKQKSVLH